MAGLRTEYRDGVLIAYFLDAELSNDDRIKEVGSELVTLARQAAEKKLLVSFRGVRFITSLMFGQLVLLRQVCNAEQIALKICEVGPDLVTIFRTMHLDTLIELGGDEASTLASFVTGFAGPAVPDGLGAAEEHREAAEAGDAAAQYALAKCYENGCGVEQDFAEAYRWYERAAGQGHAEAQHMLGTCFAYGMHVSQDYRQAMAWFEKAARQGHAESQYLMGVTHHHGLVGAEDLEAAAQWYRLAADQGHTAARDALAELQTD